VTTFSATFTIQLLSVPQYASFGGRCGINVYVLDSTDVRNIVTMSLV